MKTEFEWFMFASKAKARKSIHFQRYQNICLTFSLGARRDGKFVKSRPPDATGQAYGTSEALAPANPSRTSLDIVGLASFYKLSVVVCCPVFLSAGLSFDGFAFGRQIQSANQSKSKTNFPKFPDTAPIWSICRLAHLPLFFLPSDDPFWWPWRAYIREVQEDCLWTLQDRIRNWNQVV